MELSSLLEKAHLTSSKGKDQPDELSQPPITLAPGQGETAADDSDQSDSGDEDDDDAAKQALRTYDIFVRNTSTFPLQLVSWPVRASKGSDYKLATYRGAESHTSVAGPAGTLFTDEEIKLGSTRGPRSLDFRKRWMWIYVDLVTPRRKVHLQLYVKTDRKGIDEASLGRTDLDSTKDNPQSSGALGGDGSVVIDNQQRKVTFVVDASFESVENEVDDTMEKRKLTSLRGKGLEINSWVSAEVARTSLMVGEEARYHEFAHPTPPSRLSTLRSSTHRIDGIRSRTIAAFVEHAGNPWWSGVIEIHPVTGIATGEGFDSTAESLAIFGEKATINYGFHDAGERRRSQVYVYVTQSQHDWMGQLFNGEQGAQWRSKPFSTLALPGSHDSGMYGPLDGGLAALIQEGHLGHALANHVATKIASPIIRNIVDMLELIKLNPERVLANIAMTQKDDIMGQLRIGVRFFDMRPGFCFHDVIHTKKGRLHHQHALVPGCTYLSFLLSILNFLADHPWEIVVVELKSDGFVVKEDKYRDNDGDGKAELVVYSMIPSLAELEEMWEEARSLAEKEEARHVLRGGPEDMGRPIGELLDEKRRVIFIDQVHAPGSWARGDSYDHVAYNTDDPATIIAALEKTHAESSHPDDEPAAAAAAAEDSAGVPSKAPRGCIYQLQATPTANLLDDLFASLTYSDSSSLLTYVKPKMDRVTYPWVASKTFAEPGNIVLLQDFVEGLVVEHAREVSRQRAGL